MEDYIVGAFEDFCKEYSPETPLQSDCPRIPLKVKGIPSPWLTQLVKGIPLDSLK